VRLRQFLNGGSQVDFAREEQDPPGTEGIKPVAGLVLERGNPGAPAS
jgi:hypothetical protein